MRQSFFDYCKQYHKEALLDEWDTEHNLPMTPQTVTYGSHKSAWWRCENGHEWKAAVYTRSAGARCPYCTDKCRSEVPELKEIAPGHLCACHYPL